MTQEWTDGCRSCGANSIQDDFNSSLDESTGWVCWDTLGDPHLMRATRRQVLNVPDLPSIHWLLYWSWSVWTDNSGSRQGHLSCSSTKLCRGEVVEAAVAEEQWWVARNAGSTCPSLPEIQPTRNRPQIGPPLDQTCTTAPLRGKDRGILEESAWVRLRCSKRWKGVSKLITAALPFILWAKLKDANTLWGLDKKWYCKQQYDLDKNA